MALQKIIKEPHLTIGIWNIEDMKKDTKKISAQAAQIDAPLSIVNKRRLEQLSTHLLLKKIRPNTSIHYNSFGAPKTNTIENISISHTNEKVAIIISKHKVGVDIEKISSRALKVSEKFMDKSVYNKLCKNKATLIWSAKEAIYKWHEKGCVNFLKDIIIEDFNAYQKGSLIANFQNKKLILNYKKINNHYLVYICN